MKKIIIILSLILFSCSKSDDSAETSNITFLERFDYTTWRAQFTSSDGEEIVIFRSFSNEENPNHITFLRYQADQYCKGHGVMWSEDSNGDYTIPVDEIEILTNTYDKLIYARHYNIDQIKEYEFTAVSSSRLQQRTRMIKDDLYGNTSDWGSKTTFQKVDITYRENFMICSFIHPASFRKKFD